MTTYRIRHVGSPKFREGLTAAQVLTAIEEGHFDTTDEVMAPGDADWKPIEEHPHFIKAIEELEPRPQVEKDDESRLDMNPLIDVALVLLIFFILTITYESMRKVLRAPTLEQAQQMDKPLKEAIATACIRVQAKMENGQPVITVENEKVREEELPQAIEKWAKKTKKSELVFDVDGEVPHRVQIAILDAAKGAGIENAYQWMDKTKAPVE